MLLALGAAGGAGAYAASRVRLVREERREHAEELEEMRRLADEDVTVYGEQLRRLGELLGERELDQAAREDYQVALDAYEHAKRDAPRLVKVDQISSLVDTLASGRYAIVCVRARVSGQPVPEMTLPCFFNPQHGPSSRRVMWTTARTGTRTVPACGRCATQLAARERPEVRTVQVHGRKVPYWEAGASFHPYSRGYFPEGMVASATVAWMFLPPDMGMGGGGGLIGGGSGDLGGGFDFGGFDGGGGDGGGGGN